MKDAPFVEALVAEDSADPAAQAARKKLSAILTELNPAGGKTAPAGEGKNKNKAAKKAKRAAKAKAP